MSENIELWVVAETETEIEVKSDVRGTDGERDSGYVGPQFGDPKSVKERIATLTRKRVPIDVVMLKRQMSGMLRVVNQLFTEAEVETGMQLEEVELKVEINGEGQLSLVGNGGKLGNTGGITLKFSRPKA